MKYESNSQNCPCLFTQKQMEKKNAVLEAFVKDICMQNMVLVHTVEELEKEADQKVAQLKKKISESTHLTKEHMEMIQKYENQMEELLTQKQISEQKYRVSNINSFQKHRYMNNMNPTSLK